MVTRDMVIERLYHFGYVVKVEDYSQLDFEIDINLKYVENNFNIKNIPTILEPRIVNKICADFLFHKKNSGTLEDFDYDAVVKEIKEGDTTVKYATGQGEDTPENRFDNLVKQLERGCDKWYAPYRALRW